MANTAFSNNTGQSRYELQVDGRIAGFAEYETNGDKVRFTHTEVEPEHEGKGVGSELAQKALDDVREQGLRAVPSCKFIAKYIERNPEYADLVSASEN